MTTLVTGVAGFIGLHVALRLLADGGRVSGIDNLNAYYDPQLKRARLDRLRAWPGFEFAQTDVADRTAMERMFERAKWDLVIHLAAQAGVRHSIDNPHVYAEANVTGFLHILEGCRRARVPHLMYASSSSVYGDSSRTPLRVTDRTDSPVSLYAATKKANELMAHSYAHLFGIRTTGLRFFTVYGPWGRPDMAPFRFARAISRGERIDIYNYGRMRRDFTYIDDVVEGVARLAGVNPQTACQKTARQRTAHQETALQETALQETALQETALQETALQETAGDTTTTRTAGASAEGANAISARIFNLGHGHPLNLMEFIRELEQAFGRRAAKRFLPAQPGDVISTHADVEDLYRFTGFRPSTPVAAGVEQFAAWYREYYGEEQHEHSTGRYAGRHANRAAASGRAGVILRTS